MNPFSRCDYRKQKWLWNLDSNCTLIWWVIEGMVNFSVLPSLQTVKRLMSKWINCYLRLKLEFRTSRSVCLTQIKQSLRLFIPSRLKPTHHSGSTHILCYPGHSSSQLLQHWFQSCDHIQDLPRSSLKLLPPSSLLNYCSPSLPPFLLLSTLFLPQTQLLPLILLSMKNMPIIFVLKTMQFRLSSAFL